MISFFVGSKWHSAWGSHTLDGASSLETWKSPIFRVPTLTHAEKNVILRACYMMDRRSFISKSPIFRLSYSKREVLLKCLYEMPWCKLSPFTFTLQATTAVAETTVVADIRGLTGFSAIDVVLCRHLNHMMKDKEFANRLNVLSDGTPRWFSQQKPAVQEGSHPGLLQLQDKLCHQTPQGIGKLRLWGVIWWRLSRLTPRKDMKINGRIFLKKTTS